MKKKKLQAKDLVMAGVFTVIYIVLVTILSTLLAAVPILFLAAPFIIALFCAPVYMLYITRVPKTGAVMILALLTGLSMSMASIWILVYVLVLGLIAEAVLYITKHSARGIQISYLIFALDSVGSFLTLFFARDTFLARCEQYYGAEYVETIERLTPAWSLIVIALTAVTGAFIGVMIGKKMLNKHFEKAGIV